MSKEEKTISNNFYFRIYPFLVHMLSKLKMYSCFKTLCFKCDMSHVTCSTLCPMTKVGHLLVMVFGLLTMTTRIQYHFLLQPLITHVKRPLCYTLTTFTILPLVKTHTLIFFLQRENWDSTSLPLTRTYISL